jgi:DNA-binding NarL/FixJ family response regulator
MGTKLRRFYWMTKNARVRIPIADNFKEWRDQIREILRARPEWQVVAEACDGHEAASKASELHPDIVLLDLALPVANGIETARMMRQMSPKSKIIFVTQNTDPDIMRAAMATGAAGYVLKAEAVSRMLDSIAVALRNS